MIEFDHPFYRPLATRIIIVVACLGWGAFEFIGGNPGWGTMFGAVGLFAAYKLLITYKPKD